MLGRIRMYNDKEGYGFIYLRHPVGNITEAFFHISSVDAHDRLEQGWLVEFKLDQNRRDHRKVVAADVVVVDKSPLVEVSLSDLQVILHIVDDIDELEHDELRARRSILDAIDSYLQYDHAGHEGPRGSGSEEAA